MHPDVEVEDGPRVPAGDQDREERGDAEHREREPQEHQHHVVRDHQHPLDQPEPSVQTGVEGGVDMDGIDGCTHVDRLQASPPASVARAAGRRCRWSPRPGPYIPTGTYLRQRRPVGTYTPWGKDLVPCPPPPGLPSVEVNGRELRRRSRERPADPGRWHRRHDGRQQAAQASRARCVADHRRRPRRRAPLPARLPLPALRRLHRAAGGPVPARLHRRRRRPRARRRGPRPAGGEHRHPHRRPDPALRLPGDRQRHHAPPRPDPGHARHRVATQHLRLLHPRRAPRRSRRP